jgi:hypothetical protein
MHRSLPSLPRGSGDFLPAASAEPQAAQLFGAGCVAVFERRATAGGTGLARREKKKTRHWLLPTVM